MANRKARAHLALGVIALFVGMWILSSGCEREPAEQQNRLLAQIDSLKSVVTMQAEELANLPQADRPMVVSNYQLKELREMGLEDPQADLAEDLRHRKDLFPAELKSELGGTFGFYDPDGIVLLTTKWVLASFDDGHRLGHMLLEFSVTDGGKIDWKLIAWAIND